MNRKLKLEELNRVSIADFKHQKKDPVIVLLDNVRSLHNVGSVFRTCRWRDHHVDWKLLS